MGLNEKGTGITPKEYSANSQRRVLCPKNLQKAVDTGGQILSNKKL